MGIGGINFKLPEVNVGRTTNKDNDHQQGRPSTGNSLERMPESDSVETRSPQTHAEYCEARENENFIQSAIRRLTTRPRGDGRSCDAGRGAANE